MDPMKDLTPKSLGAAIKMVREEKGVSVDDLAFHLRINVDQMNDIESNKTLPSVLQLMMIATKLDHILTIGMSEENETDLPVSPDEAELIYALRAKDFERFALMTAVIVGGDTFDKLSAAPSDQN